MRHINQRSFRGAAAAALVIVLAALGLAACGGSSASKTTSTASASASSANSARPGPSQFAKFRECLAKHGVKLPTPKSGGSQRGAPFLGAGGGPQGLPKGESVEQFRAASKQCGGTRFRRGPTGAGARLKNPAFVADLDKFAECMRKHGVNVPTPNTSGKGPIFSTKGLNAQGATFKAAQQKCSAQLQGEFRPGAGSAAGAAPGAPPTPPAG